MSAATIPARLLEQARVRPARPAYAVKRGEGWATTSWKDYAAEVRRAARALIALGMPAGGKVCILGFNRPEWCIFDLACMMAGGAPAGIYTTCSATEVAYIVAHTEAPVVLVEDRAQWEKLLAKLGELPALRHVVTMQGAEGIDHPLVLTWEQFLARGADEHDGEVAARLAALEPGGLGTLIYTSGTTGPPKGVMLTHDNLAWTAGVAQQITGGNQDDVVLSYLPLSHIAEQMFSVHCHVTAGYTVHFARSVEALAEDLKTARPTIFFGVPRVWEKFHAALSAKLADATGVKASLVRWVRGVVARSSAERCAGREPSGLLGLQDRIAHKLVISKLKPALGLDRARVLVSGAAPIARDVLEFFASLDLIVCEVYGQSEGSGPTSFNLPGKVRFGTVGPALPGVTVKIADDGEILVQGRNVFAGYYKDEATTAETLKDGWLCSGDLGAFDADGFLSITGRKKEILITAGGKNITPRNLEEAIKQSPLVAEAVLIGDRRKFLATLITLDEAAAARFAKERGVSGPVHASSELRAALQAHIDTLNQEFARVEQVKKFTVLPGQFTLEGGELTPSLKLKRKVVNEKYAAEIEAMYAE